ncbi:MAG: PDZ domain-containing protein [Rhodanobacter sp.]
MTYRSALLLACMVTTSAVASELYVNQQNAQGSLSWRDSGRVFGLHSDAAHGVVVTRAGTDGTWGLQQGDVILALDGYPVGQVATLVERLRTSKPVAVELRVRRGQVEQELTWAAKDYGHLIGPRPPVPL